ncbi:EscU/YscU/HrcU family type III secretion system export apparatus switch protein [Tepidamorphus sp. 3E244]|uniref:EscU/YscU/HrcU family type III secretion system export apparatus switch protein n=1 Tax=Tepidamorphus sp. 3E244 TaxID=3385498 RepID=UPI0038FC985B
MSGSRDKDPTGRDLAVALGYDHGTGDAPTVLAKGHGETARRIIESAKAHGIHIEENPVLAEALAQVELDETIPHELYAAVAQVISFVLQQARKRR